MQHLLVRALASLLALLLLLPGSAFAGGWSVTTVDSVPAELTPGQTYRIGFVMRQHGFHPVVGGTPSLVVQGTADTLRFAAVEEGEPGHYVAEVTFPTDGEFSWAVDQRPFPQIQALGTVAVQGPLTVAADLR
jgi:hypothetical protein